MLCRVLHCDLLSRGALHASMHIDSPLEVHADLLASCRRLSSLTLQHAQACSCMGLQPLTARVQCQAAAVATLGCKQELLISALASAIAVQLVLAILDEPWRRVCCDVPALQARACVS